MRLVFLLSLMVDSFLHFPFICLWYSIRLERVKHIRDTKVFFSSQANLQLFFLACGKYHRDISHVERESRRFLYIGEPCLPSFLPRCHIAKFATLLNILKVVAKGVQGLSNLFIRFIIQFNFYSSTCEICCQKLFTLV